MNGKLSQPLVVSTVRKEVNGVSNQATGVPPNLDLAFQVTDADKNVILNWVEMLMERLPPSGS